MQASRQPLEQRCLLCLLVLLSMLVLLCMLIPPKRGADGRNAVA